VLGEVVVLVSNDILNFFWGSDLTFLCWELDSGHHSIKTLSSNCGAQHGRATVTDVLVSLLLLCHETTSFSITFPCCRITVLMMYFFCSSGAAGVGID
jgi:hypothetical protein